MSEQHFGQVAADYDRLRTGGGRWTEIADLTLERLGPARRLIDVGCGTGRFAAYAGERLGARVWGIDASQQMLEQARARDAGRLVAFRQADAARLPFKDEWFDAAHMHLVLHLVEDPDAVLSEVRRVLAPGARLVIVTFSPQHFERFFLNPYFPSVATIDAERFATPEALAAQLNRAGFGNVVFDPLERRTQAAASDVLERVRGRYISTLSLVAPDEYAQGLARLESDVAGGLDTFAQELHWLLVSTARA